MATYVVIVGNLGTVYHGKTKRLAYEHFEHYKRCSTEERGRVRGEPVTVFEDGKIVLEHVPSNPEPEHGEPVG